jgi:NDP-sugar pyrophosphorylase family protein
VIFEDGKLKLYSKSTHSHSMHYIDYGLTIVRKSIFDNIKKGDIFDFSIILETLSNKNELGAFEVPKRFYEIGSFQGIKDLEYYLKIIN